MRRQKIVVFDDQLCFATPTNPAYSSAAFNAILGKFDRLRFECVVDNVRGFRPLDIFLQHSPDAEHWVHKNGTPDKPPVTGQGDVSWTTLSSTSVNYLVGDSGPSPTFSFARFQLIFSTGLGDAHVKITVTPRDAR